ncbi:MAG: cupredoxin domain-containing protein [Candidatus Brennerbacteria bacterium]
MDENKKVVWWIVGGVILGVVVIYFAVSGGVDLSGTPSYEGVQTEQGTVVVPGTNPVSDEGVVVNEQGVEVQSDAPYGSAEAPQQSALVNKEELPDSVIQIEQLSNSFSPSQFTVNAGRAVVLSVTAQSGCSFRFQDAALSAIGVGVGPGETRVVPFNAPEIKGRYQFFCDIPGYETRGWVGTMIVE